MKNVHLKLDNTSDVVYTIMVRHLENPEHYWKVERRMDYPLFLMDYISSFMIQEIRHGHGAFKK